VTFINSGLEENVTHYGKMGEGIK